MLKDDIIALRNTIRENIKADESKKGLFNKGVLKSEQDTLFAIEAIIAINADEIYSNNSKIKS